MDKCGRAQLPPRERVMSLASLERRKRGLREFRRHPWIPQLSSRTRIRPQALWVPCITHHSVDTPSSLRKCLAIEWALGGLTSPGSTCSSLKCWQSIRSLWGHGIWKKKNVGKSTEKLHRMTEGQKGPRGRAKTEGAVELLGEAALRDHS